ncbi:MAG: 2-hydroxyglutaryl-CoA dehydratase [Deltaproteobacteria bacterium]|nr:2-hydroxyglutaryl-CoA dehydratase [Deltaproteobacteria bacterium]
MNAAGIGVDAGSTVVKACAVTAAGSRIWQHVELTEPRLEEQARRIAALAREQAGAAPLVATGYGRKLVAGAERAITEITCHARGVFAELGSGGTVVDIGGQDSKVISVGADGSVRNFAMNDKCAAGTGRFLEVTAARLRLAVEEIGAMALAAAEEVPISSTCAVFAESEIVSLIARGAALEAIVRGLHRSLVARLASLVRSLGIVEPVALSGGVARNPAIAAFLAEALGCEVKLPEAPQLMGAYGAALLALD